MINSMQPVQSEAQKLLERAISGIREKFIDDLDARLALLDHFLNQVEEANDLSGSLKQISDEAHRIAGVAKTLGFSELGQMAARVENDIGCALKPRLRTPESIALIVQSVDTMLNHMDGLKPL